MSFQNRHFVDISKTSVLRVDSRLVTGKNGNSIFLPAAGYRRNTNLVDAGSYGYYWSSSLHTYYPDHALCVDFGSSYVRRCDLNRYCGQSVRPVTE